MVIIDVGTFCRNLASRTFSDFQLAPFGIDFGVILETIGALFGDLGGTVFLVFFWKRPGSHF